MTIESNATAEVQPNKKRRTKGERYAIPSLDILESGLSSNAMVLYTYCDGIEGKSGRSAQGVNEVAAAINLGKEAMTSARKECRDAGLIQEDPNTTDTNGHRKTTFRVIHNSARNPARINPSLRLPPNTRKGAVKSDHYPGAPVGRKPASGPDDLWVENPPCPRSETRIGEGRKPASGNELVVGFPTHTLGLRGSEAGIRGSVGGFGTDAGTEVEELVPDTEFYTHAQTPETPNVDTVTGEILDGTIGDIVDYLNVPRCTNCGKSFTGDYGECCDCPF